MGSPTSERAQCRTFRACPSECTLSGRSEWVQWAPTRVQRVGAVSVGSPCKRVDAVSPPSAPTPVRAEREWAQ